MAWPRKMILDNPVVIKELRSRMRGGRAYGILTAHLVLLSLLVVLVYLLARAADPSAGSVDERRVIGKAIFGLVTGMELLGVCFIAPALTAGAISAERERQTYDLLRVTLLSPRDLVLGKFLSALVFILLLFLAAIPLQSLAFLFGGVALEEALIGVVLLVVTAVAFCAVGVFFSSFLARTLTSTVLAYAFAILLVFGLPLLYLVIFGLFNAAVGGLFGQVSPATEVGLLLGGWLLVATNPLATALVSEFILLEQGSVFRFSLPISSGPSLELVSPWILYVGLYLVFSLVLLWISVMFVRKLEQ